MGGGIWSMHFVGMLAIRSPVPVTYGIGLTVLSLVVAVLATAGGFFWVSRPRAGRADVAAGGLFMGVAIAGMHYIGMLAMRMPTTLTFAPDRVALSVLIAVVASTAGLSIAFRRHQVALRALAALVMGLAVSGMHYTGMWAAKFGARPASAAPAASGAPDMLGGLGEHGLVLWVVGATFVILFLALLASTISQQRAQRLLRTSEARFRVAAEAVGDIIWTNTPDGRMVGEQADWSRFTGQTRAQYQELGWTDAVHAGRPGCDQGRLAEAVTGRRIFEFEHRVRRHDGAWRAVRRARGAGVHRGWRRTGMGGRARATSPNAATPRTSCAPRATAPKRRAGSRASSSPT